MANTQSHSLTRLLALGLLTTQIAAHGYVQGIVADGVYYPGYRPSFQYLSSPPKVPGWSEPKNLDNGFINNYQSPDIICHLSATPGQAYATVQAGGTVELQWTPWPTAHLGPVLSYLANCNGDCTTVDKTTLLFNKIDAVGLIKGGYSPGYWGASTLIANNNSWTLTIPPSIAPGNYVLRHEIIALQQADAVGGAQNYPQCINLKVTGSGTNSLQTGTKATAFYTSQDPGILINIYQALSNYIIPGPPLLGGVSSGNGPQPASNLTGPSPASFPNTTATAGIYSNTSTTAATNTSTAMLNATTPTASARLASLSATPGVFVPTTLSTVTSLGGAASPFAVDEAVSTTTETDYTTTTVTVTAPGVFAVTSGSTASDSTTTTEAGNADPVDPTSTSTGFSACIPWTTTPPTTGSATYTGPVIAGRPTGTSSGFLTRTTTAPFGVLYDAGNSTSVYASGSGTAFVMGTGVGTVTVTIMGTVTDYATTTPRVDASGFAARARVDNGFRAKQRRRALLRDRQ